MTKKEKQQSKLTNNPKNVTFKELDQLLVRYGFTRSQPGSGSSHYVYKKETMRITVPYKRPYVKEIYVKQVLQMIEEINL